MTNNSPRTASVSRAVVFMKVLLCCVLLNMVSLQVVVGQREAAWLI